MPDEKRLDFGEHNMRVAIRRTHRDFFQYTIAFRQREAAEIAGGINRQQQSSAHGPSRYTLSIAYALPFAFRIDTRKLNVPGSL